MVKNKKKDIDFNKLGIISSVFLFLVSWFGFFSVSLLFGLEIVKVINNTTIKGLFFLPFYFIVLILYGILTMSFASRIIRIKRGDVLNVCKKKKSKSRPSGEIKVSGSFKKKRK